MLQQQVKQEGSQFRLSRSMGLGRGSRGKFDTSEYISYLSQLSTSMAGGRQPRVSGRHNVGVQVKREPGELRVRLPTSKHQRAVVTNPERLDNLRLRAEKNVLHGEIVRLRRIVEE